MRIQSMRKGKQNYIFLKDELSESALSHLENLNHQMAVPFECKELYKMKHTKYRRWNSMLPKQNNIFHREESNIENKMKRCATLLTCTLFVASTFYDELGNFNSTV